MRQSNFSRPRWWRISAVILGIVVLLWLPIEDASEKTAVLFAFLICALFAARMIVTSLENKPEHPEGETQDLNDRKAERFWVYPFFGALFGLTVTPVALVLMAFKSGLHGHSATDYTSSQIVAVLSRTPFWVAAGLLLGLGVGYWLWKRD